MSRPNPTAATMARSEWGRHHSPKCPSLKPGVSAACCSCAEDSNDPKVKEPLSPRSRIMAARRALETCECGQPAAYAIDERGVCRACAAGGAELHREGCAAIAARSLPSCTCGVRGQLRSL